MEIASVLIGTGKLDEAQAKLRTAESLLASLASSNPVTSTALADCRRRMARVLHSQGKFVDALAACKGALADQEILAKAPGASDDVRFELGRTIHELGLVLYSMNQLEEADAQFRAALEIQQALADAHSGDIEFCGRLATYHGNLGMVLRDRGKYEQGESEIRQSMAIDQRLADEHPPVTIFRANLARCRLTLGELLLSTGNLTGSEAELQIALGIFQRLVDEDSSIFDALCSWPTLTGALGTCCTSQVGRRRRRPNTPRRYRSMRSTRRRGR